MIRTPPQAIPTIRIHDTINISIFDSSFTNHKNKGPQFLHLLLDPLYFILQAPNIPRGDKRKGTYDDGAGELPATESIHGIDLFPSREPNFLGTGVSKELAVFFFVLLTADSTLYRFININMIIKNIFQRVRIIHLICQQRRK